MNPVVMQGEMLAALESEGLQEALQRRWLVPDPDTGFLLVSQDQNKVNEMREVVEQNNPAKKDVIEVKEEWTKSWERPNASHQFAMNHSDRNISELLSPGTGHDSGSSLRVPPPATPTGRPAMPPTAPPAAAAGASTRPPSAPNANLSPATGRAGIGDNVMVMPGGANPAESQTYTGKVTKSANGMVTVAFGNTEREFPENEVKLVGGAA